MIAFGDSASSIVLRPSPMRVESWSGLFVSYQPMSCSQAGL